MEVRVADRLAAGLIDVCVEVESVRPILFVELRAELCGQTQGRVAIVWQEREKVRLVTVGNDEDVSGIEWLSIVERDAWVAHGQKPLPQGDAITERALVHCATVMRILRTVSDVASHLHRLISSSDEEPSAQGMLGLKGPGGIHRRRDTVP
jgi:hypothetical protein